MPKLSVSIDLEFKTGPVKSVPDGGKEVVTNKYRDEILDKIPKEEYGFVLRSINNDDVATDYQFFSPDGKKNSKIEICSRGEEAGLIGRVSGDFSVSLRAGISQQLLLLGDKLDLRLTGLTSKQLWRGVGFESMVDGYDDMTSWDYPESFLFLPGVSKFSIK